MKHDHLAWPFFEDRHRELAAHLGNWASQYLNGKGHDADVDAQCRSLVRALGAAGWLRHAVAGTAYGGATEVIDTRAICLLRETLAFHHGLADFAFAMQGLGSGAISLAGTHAQRQRFLPRVAEGSALAAFALSEPEAGSDVAAMRCAARDDGDVYVIDGEKTWISNGGIADVYVLFARTGEAEGSRGISAFVVEAGTPGFEIAQRIDVIAPHPLARLRFEGCRVPKANRLGEPGEGFKIAMRTLDVFRTSVAAAALGFGRRALHEGLERARSREMFGQRLADFQLTQAKLAQMSTELTLGTLLALHLGRRKDSVGLRPDQVSIGKLNNVTKALEICRTARTILGANGISLEYPVIRHMNNLESVLTYEGTPEMHTLMIGQALTGEAAYR